MHQQPALIMTDMNKFRRNVTRLNLDSHFHFIIGEENYGNFRIAVS